VTILEPERALVLGGNEWPDGSRIVWSFHLLDAEGGRTRLLERRRNQVGKGFFAKIVGGPYLIDPIGFVMSRKMLRTIKELSEASSRNNVSP
jgi:hypothetical protein